MSGINRFFTDESISDGVVTLTDGNVHHIKNVLRMREGEKLILVKNKKELLCTIDKTEKNSIILSVEKELFNNSENPFSLTLIQGVPKGDKSDFIVEKAVEAGANEIVFVNLKRSVARLKGDNAEKKLERFRKISESAAKQCGRLTIPSVGCINELVELEKLPKDTLKLLCYEDEKNATLKSVLKNVTNPTAVAVIIGPEGGIDKEEADYLINSGFLCVTLGSRILRCETAGLYALACINYELNK